MANSGSSSNDMQTIITNTFRELANTSLRAYRPVMDVMMNSISSMSRSMQRGNYGALRLPLMNNSGSDCCPPKCECPPHCIAGIYRCAMPGERIIVPFLVKNNCSQTKTYRIGVRELKDEDGGLAPSQPVLNRQSVTLDPGRSERVLMTLDLGNFRNGVCYTTEIVLREKNINQNIWFTLELMDEDQPVTAEPRDEQKMQLHWQSWQSHYYCEPQRDRPNPVPNKDETPKQPI